MSHSNPTLSIHHLLSNMKDEKDLELGGQHRRGGHQKDNEDNSNSSTINDDKMPALKEEDLELTKMSSEGKQKGYSPWKSLEIFFNRHHQLFRGLFAILVALFFLLFFAFCLWHLFVVVSAVPSLFLSSEMDSIPLGAANSTKPVSFNPPPRPGLFDGKVLTATDYHSYINSNDYVLVEFKSSDCSDCFEFGPILKKIYHRFQKKSVPISVAELDCFLAPSLCEEELKVDSFPTLRLFSRGKAIGKDFLAAKEKDKDFSPETVLLFLNAKEGVGEMLDSFVL
jgi:thiol-disulfide isomerase/thioredoxin